MLWPRSITCTSFSCPLAAGVVALLVQANPSASVDQVVFHALRSTASQAAAPDNLLGYGIVDALAALRVVAPSRLPSSRRPSPG